MWQWSTAMLSVSNTTLITYDGSPGYPGTTASQRDVVLVLLLVFGQSCNTCSAQCTVSVTNYTSSICVCEYSSVDSVLVLKLCTSQC
jgi:hypothetical protein